MHQNRDMRGILQGKLILNIKIFAFHVSNNILIAVGNLPESAFSESTADGKGKEELKKKKKQEVKWTTTR